MNISISPEKKEIIEQRARKAGKTVSAYILYTVDLVDQMISEDELVQIAKKAKKNYEKGRTKELRSLADLMK